MSEVDAFFVLVGVWLGSFHPKCKLSKIVPALENKISKLGKLVFQGRKRKFPTVEKILSSRGKRKLLPCDG